MPEIAVVGSLNLDTTVRVPRLPAPGETILGTGHFDDTGGKGANQAVAARRLGREVAMIGMVGDDAAGRRLVGALQAEGIAVDGVVSHPEVRSGIAVITVDDAGENMIVVDPGANGSFTPEALGPVSAAVERADVVLIQLEIPLPTVVAAIGAARGRIVLNPAPAQELDKALLGEVDVLVPNATELARLIGAKVPPTGPEEAIEMARRMSGPGAVVVTLGAHGAVVVSSGGESHIAAPTVDAVDPTAAGDAFCGGLADALVRDEPLDDAVAWAVRVGAVAATRFGAQAALPSRQEVFEMSEGT